MDKHTGSKHAFIATDCGSFSGPCLSSRCGWSIIPQPVNLSIELMPAPSFGERSRLMMSDTNPVNIFDSIRLSSLACM